ncbi:hypothetical protein JCM24511_02619 [Saitozyma sp. JCM 24511]|nr:hypothetical protein JCM24511_02619 [Saitozyma sp. JCM 24511]
MSTSTHYAALVIGSGQGGTPLATAFAKAGHKTALVEATHVGGCCINEGCTPTKTMIASGRVAYLTRRAADFGVHTRDIKVDMEKVRQRKRDIVESFRSGSERRLKDGGVTLIRGTASFVDDKTVRVRGTDGEQTISADRIVINTGARPVIPRLEGLDTATFPEGTVLDSTTIQELGVVPNHLVVIGGGYIGVEFGQLFRRLGARVTILQRNAQLLPREDSDVAATLWRILKEDGITVHFNATPTRITTSAAPHSMHPVTLTVKFHDGAEIELQSSHVLFAAGRAPNTDTLNPGAAGVSLGPGGYVKVDEQLRTTNPRIWSIGDVKGGPAFTHVSYDDYRIVQRNLITDTSSSAATITDRDLLTTYVVYTDPQLGHIGLHLHEAQARFPGVALQVATMPMNYVARALETDETRGLMKAVVNKESKRILGFTCLGLEGGEIMSVVQMTMVGGLPYTALQNAMFSHPTLAESLNNLWGFLKDV